MPYEPQRKPKRDYRRASHHTRPFWGRSVKNSPSQKTPFGAEVGETSRGEGLFAKLCELETMEAAWRAVKKSRTASARRFRGTADRVSLELYERNLDRNLNGLRSDLQSGRYRPDRVISFRMVKPGGGHRVLTVLTVSDRIAQRATLGLVEPLFEPLFLPCSFAFRPNRSTQDALALVESYYAEGYHWVVQADIEAFFDNIDRERLVRLLAEKVADPRLLALLKLWLKSQANLTIQPDPALPSSPVAGGGKIVSISRQTALAPVPDGSGSGGSEEAGKLAQLARFFLQTSLEGVLNNLLPDPTSPGPGSFDRDHDRTHAASRYTIFEDDDYDDDYEDDEKSYPKGRGEEDAETDWEIFQVGRNRTKGVSDTLSQELLGRAGRDGLLAAVWLARKLVKGQWKPGPWQGVMGGAVVGAGLGTLAWKKWRSRQKASQKGTVLDEIVHFIPPARRGVAQGSILSPLYSNIYLHHFDQVLTEKGRRLVRFADDLVIVCGSRKEAAEALAQAEKILGELGLSFKASKTKILRLEKGFKFLGAELDARGHWLTPRMVGRSPGPKRLAARHWVARLQPEWLRRTARTTPGVVQKGRQAGPLSDQVFPSESSQDQEPGEGYGINED